MHTFAYSTRLVDDGLSYFRVVFKLFRLFCFQPLEHQNEHHLKQWHFFCPGADSKSQTALPVPVYDNQATTSVSPNISVLAPKCPLIAFSSPYSYTPFCTFYGLNDKSTVTLKYSKCINILYCSGQGVCTFFLHPFCLINPERPYRSSGVIMAGGWSMVLEQTH